MTDDSQDYEGLHREWDAYSASIERDLDHILHYLWRSTDEVLSAVDASIASIDQRRREVWANWRQQRTAQLQQMKDEAHKRGLGLFDSDEEFLSAIRPLSFAEEGPFDDLFFDWHGTEHEFHLEHGATLSDGTQNFIYYGATVALQALSEQYLGSLCELVQVRRKSRIAVTDLKGGSDIFRARDYLEKVHAVDTPPAIWEELRPFMAVRNCIAHESGFVTKPPHITILKPRKDLSIENGPLVLTRQFVGAHDKAITELSRSLDEHLRQWSGLRLVR